MTSHTKDLNIAPDQPVRFTMGVIVTVLVAAFILGSTFTAFTMKLNTLAERVDRLAAAMEKHIGATSTVSLTAPKTSID